MIEQPVVDVRDCSATEFGGIKTWKCGWADHPQGALKRLNCILWGEKGCRQVAWETISICSLRERIEGGQIDNIEFRYSDGGHGSSSSGSSISRHRDSSFCSTGTKKTLWMDARCWVVTNGPWKPTSIRAVQFKVTEQRQVRSCEYLPPDGI